jgi:hypothetical protein
MAKYKVHLRYYVGDPLAEIRQEDLDQICRTRRVEVSFKRIDNRVMSDGMMREETLDKAIEEITQDVITVLSDDEKGFREALKAIYDLYRSPRTPYSLWGSSPDGQRVAKEVLEETGGGW